jgi:two-component system LytT family response regulator
MKRIVIIDDEADARESLRNLLALCPGVELVGEADGIATGFQLLASAKPDAVLLDISLSDGTGFDLLDRFPVLPFRVIFTTAHDEFALRAFRYHALDYLMKPIIPKELMDAIERIAPSTESYALQVGQMLQGIRSRSLEKIALGSQEGLVFIRLIDIVRLESEGNYTTFFTKNKERHVVSKNIKEYEDMLPADAFCRVHQSHIVHFAFVKKYMREDGGYLEMEGGYKVPIARRRKEELMRWLEG